MAGEKRVSKEERGQRRHEHQGRYD